MASYAILLGKSWQLLLLLANARTGWRSFCTHILMGGLGKVDLSNLTLCCGFRYLLERIRLLVMILLSLRHLSTEVSHSFILRWQKRRLLLGLYLLLVFPSHSSPLEWTGRPTTILTFATTIVVVFAALPIVYLGVLIRLEWILGFMRVVGFVINRHESGWWFRRCRIHRHLWVRHWLPKDKLLVWLESGGL